LRNCPGSRRQPGPLVVEALLRLAHPRPALVGQVLVMLSPIIDPSGRCPSPGGRGSTLPPVVQTGNHA
jgi:hypothetical protein